MLPSTKLLARNPLERYRAAQADLRSHLAVCPHCAISWSEDDTMDCPAGHDLQDYMDHMRLEAGL